MLPQPVFLRFEIAELGDRLLPPGRDAVWDLQLDLGNLPLTSDVRRDLSGLADEARVLPLQREDTAGLRQPLARRPLRSVIS